MTNNFKRALISPLTYKEGIYENSKWIYIIRIYNTNLSSSQLLANATTDQKYLMVLYK